MDLKLELLPVPVTDVDRAKGPKQVPGLGWATRFTQSATRASRDPTSLLR
jgi:hypothetical protein